MARYADYLMGGMQDRNFEQLINRFKNLATDEDRILLARTSLSKRDSKSGGKAPASKFAMKSATDSEMYRNEGNKYYKDKLYKKALDFYTKSMIAAPAPDERESDDRCLSKALCNRSAALFYLNEYKACLIDIEDALEAGYQEERQYLLHVRKVKCLHAMGLSTETKEAFDGVEELLTKSKVEVDQKTKILKKLKDDLHAPAEVSNPQAKISERAKVSLPNLRHGSNASHPSLSSSCKVMYDTYKGRHVVATRDIQPGEVILVEEPYSSILTEGGYDSYCHHCCRGLPIAPIACQHCTKALFCSPVCRSDAWAAYHRVECSMVNTDCTDEFFLALRIVLVAGIDELLKYRDGLIPAAEMTFAMAGCNEQGHYKSTDFNTINYLVRHADKLSDSQFFLITMKAAEYTKALENVNFFHSIPAEEKESAVLYVEKCLTHIMQATAVNAVDIPGSEFVGKPRKPKIGSGLYPTFSLFSHSCANNSINPHYANTMVIHSQKTIKEGEEVTIPYCENHWSIGREERQQILQKSFYFKCSCEACVNDWPLYSATPTGSIQFKCQNCQHARRPTTGRHSQRVLCPGCRKRQHIPTMEEFTRDLLTIDQEVNGLFSARKYNEALIVIEKVIVKFENTVANASKTQEFIYWVLKLVACCSYISEMYTAGQ